MGTCMYSICGIWCIMGFTESSVCKPLMRMGYKTKLDCIVEMLFVADLLLLVSFFTFLLTMAAISRLISTTLRLRS